MLTKKIIKKIVEKATKESFKDGAMQEGTVTRFSQEFASLPKAEGIAFLTLYLKGVQRELNKQTLLIESAIPIPKTKVTQIENRVKKSHLVTNVDLRTNPGLLGGLKIKIGDEVYEGTLLRRIEELGKIISNG